MARRRGRSPRGGRRGQEEMVAQPVAEEVLEFAEPGPPARGGRRSSGGGGAAGGPGIGIIIPLAVTLVAAVMLILGGFMVSSSASKAVDGTLEQTTLAMAQALSVIDPTWWEASHGTGKTLYELLEEKKNDLVGKEKKKTFADQTTGLIEEYEKNFKDAMDYWGIKAPDAADGAKLSAIQKANRERLEKLVAIKGTAILYASISRPGGGGTFRYSAGEMPGQLMYSQRGKKVGEGTVWNAKYRGMPAKIASYPITDAYGSDGGAVKVVAYSSAAGAGAGTTVVIIALVGILLVGGVSFGLCLAAAKGLGNLARDLEAAARGEEVRIRAGGGEVGAVARAADRALKTMRVYQDQAAMASVQAVAAPVESAGVDSASLLPTEPPRIDGYEIEAVHKPSPEGANDFFDYIQIDDNHLGVIIADLPQPGAEGAFIATTFRALVRAHAIGDTSPASVLSKINRVMANELKRGDHITAMYTILDVEKGIVSVASAGHLPLVFWKLEKKGSALLNPEGIAIGLDKGPVFEKTVVDKRIKLDRGDRFVLYTDGPVAAKNANGEEFGEQRFYYVVSREAPKNSAAFVNFVANEVDLFHEGAIQEDDITLVTVRKVS